LSVEKKKYNSFFNKHENQSELTMGIRCAMCLPRGYEVLGMETGTLSPEQGSCRRSVGKQTRLTQRWILPGWPSGPNTCCKLTGEASHHRV